MRVSIVATALDGQLANTNGVVNMVNRIQNRNTGYSDGLFSKASMSQNNSYNSISGATALKLDEQYELNTSEEDNLNPGIDMASEKEKELNLETSPVVESETQKSFINDDNETDTTEEILNTGSVSIEEDYSPKLFNEDIQEVSGSSDSLNANTELNEEENKLFNQEVQIEEDEDFEIPAFLRRQKF